MSYKLENIKYVKIDDYVVCKATLNIDKECKYTKSFYLKNYIETSIYKLITENKLSDKPLVEIILYGYEFGYPIGILEENIPFEVANSFINKIKQVYDDFYGQNLFEDFLWTLCKRGLLTIKIFDGNKKLLNSPVNEMNRALAKHLDYYKNKVCNHYCGIDGYCCGCCLCFNCN